MTFGLNSQRSAYWATRPTGCRNILPIQPYWQCHLVCYVDTSTEYIAGNGTSLNDENEDTFYYFLPNHVDSKTRIEIFPTG